MEVFTTCGAGGHGEGEEKEGEKEMGEKKGKTGERESKATLIAKSYKYTHTYLQMGTLPSLQMDTTGT